MIPNYVLAAILAMVSTLVPLRAAAATNYTPQSTVTVTVGSGAVTHVIVRSAFVIGADIPALAVVIPNWALVPVSGVSNTGNDFTVGAASIEIGSTSVPITFSGSRSVLVTDTTNALSDEIAATAFSLAKFSQGQTGFIRIRYELAANSLKLPHTGAVRGTGSASYKYDPKTVFIGTNNAIDTTGAPAWSHINGGVDGTDVASSNATPVPIIVGRHSQPAVGFWGDSKTFGTGDTATTIGLLGMSRCLAPDPTSATGCMSGINFGCPSGNAVDCYTASVSGVVTSLTSLYKYVNNAVVGYGTNTASSSTTPFTTLWAQIRANSTVTRVVQRSLTPRTGDSASLTAITSSGTACTATMADTSGLVTGQTYPIASAVPAAYNGSYVVTVVNGTTFTYTSATAPGSSASTPGVLHDQWRTLKYQTLVTNSSVGGANDTQEANLRVLVASDPNLTYYQSLGERQGTSGANYWNWKINGSALAYTFDGLHESAAGYELNIGTAGNIITQGGGTIAGSLRALVLAMT